MINTNTINGAPLNSNRSSIHEGIVDSLSTYTLSSNINQGSIIAEIVNHSASIYYKEVFSLLETLSIIDPILTKSAFKSHATSLIKTLDALAIMRPSTVIEGIAFFEATSITVKIAQEFIEVVKLYDVYSTSATLSSMLVDLILSATSLERAIYASSLETMQFTTLLSGLFKAFTEFLESIIIVDNTSAYTLFSKSISETLIKTDTFTSSGILGVLLSEEFILRVFSAKENNYVSYLLSPETNSVSTYSNYNFNGCTKFDYKYLFYNRIGLYEYGSTTDNSDPIRSEIETVAFNFQTSNLKQVPAIYLGVDSTDKVILKVRVDGRAEVHYQLNKFTNNLMTQKIDIGKGLIGRYFQFELITEASEFSMESIEFYPLEIRRKL